MSQYTPSYIVFSKEQVRMQGDQIKKWSLQNDNLLLKQLAAEVIDAAGVVVEND